MLPIDKILFMNKKILHLTILAFALVMLGSCFTITNTTTSKAKKSTSAIYNPFMYRLHPEYIVYNQNESKSVLYTKIYLSELMFSRIGPKKKNIGKLKIEYRIHPADNLGQTIDSASAQFVIRKQKGQNNIVSYLKIKDQKLNKYCLEIITTDVLRRTQAKNYIYVKKEGDGSRQNFIVNSKKTNQPYFKNFFRPEHFFSIKLNKPVDSIYIKYYKKEPPLPFPPFASSERIKINVTPDSVWSISGETAFQFHEEKKGGYFIQTDTSTSDGMGLINSGENFPYVRSSDNLVKPLQYLCSTDEYNELINSTNVKLSVDRFWLGCGDNDARSRELIRIYYNRTLYANIYFTSFTQGWRTDRGMIYLIFGPPKSVKKYPDKEIWLYSDRMHYKVLQFVFNRVDNPYSDNDFVLERHIDFKKFWSRAIKSWRGGKVYDIFQ